MTNPAAALFRQHFRREVRQGDYVMHFAASDDQALDLLAGADDLLLPVAQGSVVQRR
jgi:hypothetical protein